MSAAVDSDKQNGPRSRKGERTRARLVAAAKEVFERDGFLNARVSDIATQAGLSHGSFYHYFDSKEEVFREVAEAVEEQLSAPLGRVVLDPRSTASPFDRIHEALRQHLDLYRREARIMAVIEQVYRYDEQMRKSRLERHARYQREVVRAIRQLQRHGLADPELDPNIAAAALGSMTSRFPEIWFVERRIECDFGKGVDQLTRAFVNALGLKVAPVPVRRSRAAAGR